MKDKEFIGDEAERLLVEFTKNVEIRTSIELVHSVEMLISKSARLIEIYAGNEMAVVVCNRTARYVAAKPQHQVLRS